MEEEEAADFVIVGAGSAGCVLANRLSAGGRHGVLLLEAGPRDRNPWIHIPLGYGKLFADARHNWLFQSEPQAELHGRRIPQPRGKVLGGSSSINGLLYVRGQAEDFHLWRQLGLPGWGWEDALRCFRRAEDQERGADEWHGANGPLAVSDQRQPHPLCDAYLAACAEAGLPANADFNGRTQEGAGYYQVTARRGRRWSTARGYLRQALRRPNLRVLTGVAVSRVLFDGRRATGVRFRGPDGAEQTARARRAVLLCGGAFASPQLLQVSGVGPAEWLRDRLGVQVVADLPGVGQDLQDHLQARIVLRATRPVTVNDVVRHPGRAAFAALRWAAAGRGPLTYSAGVAGAFFRALPDADTPDVQSLLIPFSTDRMGTSLHAFPGFTASVCQLRPESRGTVMAATADMRDAPAIQPRYLSAETDRRCLLAGLRRLRDIVRQPALRPWIAAEVDPPPECDPGGGDDDALLDFIRATAGSIYHPACTARMGAEHDPGAVLDARTRVRGTEALHVIDAAAMPRLVSGNTNAGVVMLAERAAEMVLEDAAG